MRRKSVKIIVTIVVLAAITGLLVWGFIEGRKEGGMEAERERPVKPPSRVSEEGGESVVTLDRKTLERSGIQILPLVPVSHRSEIRAFGIVLQLQELFDLRASYAKAQAQAESARAAVEASGREHERLKLLNADNRNVSDKALQAATAAWRADEAALRAGKASLYALKASIRQRWGGVIAGWVTSDSPSFERLARQDDLLLQVTFPSDAQVGRVPQKITLQTAEGTPLTEARLISPSPATDPRIQGRSFFYLAPAGPRLLPGMNVLARLPVGPLLQGVTVPSSAVVWRQGKAWLYLEKGAGRFVRRALPTESPLRDSFFVARGLAPGDPVVVRGAQLLQSEEFRSQIRAGEEGDGK